MRILIIFMCLGLFAILQARYTNLNDALVNGPKKVDIILYGKSVSGFGSYINASVGLGYTTEFYYGLRGAISFRAAQSIIDSRGAFRRDFGGANETIAGNSAILLGESFLEYFDGDTAIKAGRFQPINEYINLMTDGIWIRNASLSNIILEGMWAYNSGRVAYYEMQPFSKLGGNNSVGWFDVGVKYFLSKDNRNFKDSIYISVFGTVMSNVFGSVGARWHSGFKLGKSESWLGIDAGFVASFEDNQSRFAVDNNTFLFDTKVSLGFGSWIDIFIGYVMNGKGGMGGINMLGVGNSMQAGDLMLYSNIQPFFTWGGEAIKFGRNAKLIYVSSRISLFDSLKIYVAYGMTIFDGYSGRYGSDNSFNIVQNELNVMTEFSITELLSVIAYISDTHLAKGVQNNFQINGGFRFMF